MIYSLLFDQYDQLLAAAPAAMQTAAGDSFWTEIYVRDLDVNPDCQTGFIEIDDAELIELLDSLETSEENLDLCRARITALNESVIGAAEQPKAA